MDERELLHDPGEQEVHRAKPEDREDVRGIDEDGSRVTAKIAGIVSIAVNADTR